MVLQWVLLTLAKEGLRYTQRYGYQVACWTESRVECTLFSLKMTNIEYHRVGFGVGVPLLKRL